MSKWDWTQFSNLYSVPSKNGLTAPSKVRGSGPPLVNMREIFAFDRISNQDMERAPVPERNYESWLLQADDLLFARQSLTLAGAGKVSLVHSPTEPMTFESHIIRVRLDPSVADPRFYYYLFRSRVGRALVESIVEQVAAAGIRASDLGRLKVPYPDLPEQRRIAAVLGAIDDLIDADRETMNTAIALAKAVYEHAVSGSDRNVLLGQAGTWMSGGTPATSNPAYWSGSIPWISASSLQTFFLTTSDRKLTEEGARNGTRLVPAGGIVFVVRGMSLKKEFRIGIAQRQVAFGQDCKAIVIDSKLPKSTIAVGLLSRSDEVLQLVDEASHGTGRLQTDRIEKVAIRLPSPTHVSRVEATLSALLKLGADAEVSIADLTRSRDELLPLLVSGKVGMSKDVAVP